MALIRFTSKNIDPFTGISILWTAARKLYLTALARSAQFTWDFKTTK